MMGRENVGTSSREDVGGERGKGVVTLSYSYILNILWNCNAYFQLKRTVGSGSHGMWHLSFRTVRRTRPASERCWSAADGWRLHGWAARRGEDCSRAVNGTDINRLVCCLLAR